MTNNKQETFYKRIETGIRLQRCRMNSYNPALRSVTALAKELGRSTKWVKDIESGYTNPDLELAAKWCRITGHHEQWKAIKCAYSLESYAIPPIHPEFNQRYAEASINLRKQLNDALRALDELDKMWIDKKPGQPRDARPFVEPCKQIMDVGPAWETLFIAMEREGGLSIEEVGRVWMQDALAKGILAPRIDVAKEMAVVR